MTRYIYYVVISYHERSYNADRDGRVNWMALEQWTNEPITHQLQLKQVALSIKDVDNATVTFFSFLRTEEIED